MKKIIKDIDLIDENQKKFLKKKFNVKKFENKLRWHLDFTFREDDNTTVNKNTLMNLQLINKFTLAILNRVKILF